MALTRRTQLKLAAPLAAACALVAVPAAALAGSGGGSGAPTGGAGMSGTGTPAGKSGGSDPRVHPAETPVSVSGHGITVQTLSSGQTATALKFTGTVPAGKAGRVVEIERASGTALQPTWTPVAVATVTAAGTFSAVWRASRSGRFEVEAVLLARRQTASTDATSSGGGPAPGPSTSSSGAPSQSGAVAPVPVAPGSGPDPSTSSPPMTVAIFQSSRATLYGPGFYGRRTACGQTLRRGTIGVASRTLKCGARVAIMYAGRVMDVPVIDRGPYANGADWDLTMATAHALGISSTATIGALALSFH